MERYVQVEFDSNEQYSSVEDQTFDIIFMCINKYHPSDFKFCTFLNGQLLDAALPNNFSNKKWSMLMHECVAVKTRKGSEAISKVKYMGNMLKICFHMDEESVPAKPDNSPKYFCLPENIPNWIWGEINIQVQ